MLSDLAQVLFNLVAITTPAIDFIAARWDSHVFIGGLRSRSERTLSHIDVGVANASSVRHHVDASVCWHAKHGMPQPS